MRGVGFTHFNTFCTLNMMKARLLAAGWDCQKTYFSISNPQSQDMKTLRKDRTNPISHCEQVLCVLQELLWRSIHLEYHPTGVGGGVLCLCNHVTLFK